MSKRFTDTNKWQDEWFYELRSEYKLLWYFLCDHCDACGVWKVSKRFAENTIGMAITWDQVIPEMKGRIIELTEGQRWFLVKYIPFQYHGGLVADNSIHRSVLAMLHAHGIESSPFMKGPKSGVSQARLGPGSTTQAQAQEMLSGGEGSAEGRLSREDVVRQAIEAECSKLVLCANAKAVREWMNALKEHAKCKTPEEAVACMRWAVGAARRDGKDVTYVRHVINQLMHWPDAKPDEFRRKIA